MEFHKDILKLDSKSEVERICEFIQQELRDMKRDGIVVGLSGGIDSSLQKRYPTQTEPALEDLVAMTLNAQNQFSQGTSGGYESTPNMETLTLTGWRLLL